MESGNMIDMSLDDIIKLNKRPKKANAANSSVKTRALAVKRGGVLRSTRARPMRSSQASAVRAILQEARRTAANAARVAADAVALVSPINTVSRGNNRIGAVGAAAARNNRAINRNLAVRQRIMAVNRQIFQRQRNSNSGRGSMNSRDVQSRRRQQPQRQQMQQQQQRPWRTVNSGPLYHSSNHGNAYNGSAPTSSNIQRSFRQNQTYNATGRQRQVNRANTQRLGIRHRSGQMVGAQLNTNAASSIRYEQYLQQARALIRAQEEHRDTGPRVYNYNPYNREVNNPVYEDVPVRNVLDVGGGDYRDYRFDGRTAARMRFGRLRR